MVNIVLQLALLFASLMQSPATPLRIGDVARQMTGQDITALELALPSGAKPWLVNGDHGQIPMVDYIEAYLSPTTTTASLRRGTMINVSRRRTPVSEWSAARTESYAQVAIPGRNFDQIDGDQDINRPFRVIGRFDDDELVRLVQLIRSHPPTRGTPIFPYRSSAIEAWPILSIQRRNDDSVDVSLRGAVMQGK